MLLGMYISFHDGRIAHSLLYKNIDSIYQKAYFINDEWIYLTRCI